MDLSVTDLAQLDRNDLLECLASLNKLESREACREYADDLERYCGECVFIKDKTGSLVPFRWNAAQHLLHERIKDQKKRTGKVRILVPKGRQLGVSTYVSARFYARTTLQGGKRTFILTHEDGATRVQFETVGRIHENVPENVRVTASRDNANELVFDNIGSGYSIGTARTKAKGRGSTIQLFHGSEVAFWPNAGDHMAGVLQAVPDGDDTEIILESTGNGQGGLFHDMCQEALSGDGEYELVFLPWFLDEKYRKVAPEGWEPPAGWRSYGQIHGLEGEQVYWAWSKNVDIAKACGGSTDEPCWLFAQEYPATLQEAFQAGDDSSFIRPELVTAARDNDYPEPGQDTPLVFGVDIAHGGGDKTRIIDRCGRRMGHFVNATFDEADEMVLAGHLVRLVDEFEPDMVFVDTTGGYGAGVVDRLKEQNYTNIRGINFGSSAGDKGKYANKRAEMWTRLKDWLAEGADIVPDDGLERDLTAPMAQPDSSGRLILEKKVDIRKRRGFSPDAGDAAALTFAETVMSKNAVHNMPTTTQSAYSPLGNFNTSNW